MIKRLLPKTLFGRSLIIIITPVVLLQIIATVVFYQRHWDTVTRRMTYVLAGEIAAVIEARQVFNGPDDWDRMFALVQSNMEMRVTWEPGGKLPAAPPPLSAFSSIDKRLQQSLAQQLQQPFHIDRISDPEKINVSVQLQDGVLRFLTGKKRVWSSTTYIFVLWMVGTSLVLVAIAVVFLRNQVRPIRRLAIAADAFGKGREETFLKPEGASEVRSAANAFLRMRERIQRQINQRTEMLAGVSHDLRTPLTRMKLELAMIGDSEEAEALKGDVAEMEHMIEGYLAFARGQDAEPVVKTDLCELLGDVVADARRQGSEVGLNTSPDMVIAVRPNALKRCLTNLVENARRYADHIWIAAERHADTMVILVDDDGPGIPDANRDDVFGAFFRLDESRNPDTGGSGLGLTIARDVVRGHGGDIVLEEAPAGGLRARISLPI